MDIDWHEASCEEFTAALISGECRHVGFLVGSFASCGQPSSCLSVGDIRRETVAAILRATSGSPRGHSARKVLQQIHQDLADGSGARWHEVLSFLPFEQFMACVAHGSSESALRIAQLLCGSGLPNANHDAIAKTASRILDLRLADQVTIVTTNYDMCLDDALRKTLGDPTAPLHQRTTPLLPLREYSTEHGCIRYLKIHGCLSRPESLVFSFGQMLRLLTSHDWERAILDQLGGTDQTPSLALTVGYGFWDRDLDSFLSRWLQNARVFRNDPYLASDQPRTPTQLLQSEFFEQLRSQQRQEQADKRFTRPWCVLRTPLLRDPQSQDPLTASVLQGCCLALDLPHAELPLARSATDDQRRFDEALADGWSLEATGQFLGRLCHSAERREGRRAMHALLGNFQVANTRVNVAHEYLRAIGVRDARKRGLVCARMLRRRRFWRANGPQSGGRAMRRLSRDVRAIAWAYESFMVSLMIGQAGSSKIKKALFGLNALIADRRGWLNGLGQRHTQPFPVSADHPFLSSWESVGVSVDRRVVAEQRAMRLSLRLMEQIPSIEARTDEWCRFAYRWGEFSVLSLSEADVRSGVQWEAVRQEVDRVFSEWLANHYAGLATLPPTPPAMVHHVPKYAARELQDNNGKVAIVVIDGLAMYQWIVIRDVIRGQNQAIEFEEQAAFAWLPTLTSVSRQAIFAGVPPLYFPDSLDSTDREAKLWTRFWSQQGVQDREVAYIKGLGRGGFEGVEEILTSQQIRAVGLVVDTVDRIMHGMQLGSAGMISQVKQWCREGYLTRLLRCLLDNAFLPIIVSDHGNTDARGCGRISEGAVSEVRGQRVRVCRELALRDRVIAESPGSRAGLHDGLPNDYWPVYPPIGGAFVTDGVSVVAHGGDSLDEVIVPVVTVRSTGVTK